ncbi:uncharacterized protein LOC132631549 [Lycium barbarum]|uniref:uncharacterized protein LOC132631549 n=1 Tax=Lycium barbarum TaxID=112863 RepID=UPI00293F0E2C|nr:uncharacterized protein LOC132631549 [Lycium barbarum]
MDEVQKEIGSVRDYLGQLRDWMQRKDEHNAEILQHMQGKSAVQADDADVMVENSNNHRGDGFREEVQPHFRDETRPRRLALPLFSGKARNWFQWWETRAPIVTWDVFRVAILQRFTPSQSGNLYEVLIGLKQTGSVAQYQEDFELLSAPLKDVDDAVWMGIFISGLREEINADLRLSKLGNLTQIIDQSQRIEERNWALSQAHLPRHMRMALSRGSMQFPVTDDSRTGSFTSPPSGPETSARRGGAYKTLSDAEYQDKLRKGLCFRCDEKYGPNHRCNSKKLNLLIVAAEDGEDRGTEEYSEELINARMDQLDVQGQPESQKLMELSLYSIAGFTTKKSLKVWGTILAKKVIVLIDSNASTNFISRAVAEASGLKQTETKPFLVEVGNGQQVKSRGSCKGVELWIYNVRITQDYFLFNLGSADVLLGLEWLETLGDIQANFKTLTLKFEIEGQTRVVQGDPSWSKSVASLKTLFKALQKDGEGYYVDLNELTAREEQENFDLQQLLDEFGTLFEELKRLPPSRSHDHAIRFKQGSNPPNIRPYRYPHYQKNEIERIVREMLVAAIDELLDELGGATIFSKLDLRSGYHQIQVCQEDVAKTAFRAHESHYEFLVMPFGLSNAPSTFQALMNEIFRPYLRKFVLVFLDDILVYSANFSTHLDHLREVLKILQLHNLVVNRKKCHFGQPTTGVSRTYYLRRWSLNRSCQNNKHG